MQNNKLPLVTIVGRPNVGKSSLFNKIIRKRQAIVDSQAGITRDINIKITSWNGIDFLLADSGGLVPEADDTLLKLIKNQCEKAIKESCVIVFVVDGYEGINQLDYSIAEILRKSGIPVVLAVNKIDNIGRELNVYDFFKLGFKNIVSISAAHGRGINELLDNIIKFIPSTSGDIEKSDIEKIYISVIGRPNVGKSTLVNTLLNDERVIVDESPGTTRDPIDTFLEWDNTDFVIIDTAGLRRKSRVYNDIERYANIHTIQTIERCDVGLVIFDLKEGLLNQDIKLINLLDKRGKGIILLGNKLDLITKSKLSLMHIEDIIREGLASFYYIPIIFISAKFGDNVSKILPMVKKVHFNRSQIFPESKINAVLSEAFETFPPHSKSKYPPRFISVIQRESRFPYFDIFVKNAEGITREYKRYLINVLRKNFDLDGVSVKLRIFSKLEKKKFKY